MNNRSLILEYLNDIPGASPRGIFDCHEKIMFIVTKLESHLREIALASGLPVETVDIASCDHIAHQVKNIRANAARFFEEASAHWDDGLKTAATIADAYGQGACARDIRALINAGASHGR